MTNLRPITLKADIAEIEATLGHKFTRNERREVIKALGENRDGTKKLAGLALTAYLVAEIHKATGLTIDESMKELERMLEPDPNATRGEGAPE